MANDKHTRIISVKLQNGAEVRVEATVLNPEEDVSFSVRPFEEFTAVIESISSSIHDALQRIKPKKASVEFGLEIGLESGELTALLVKGTGTANLKITLEWD